MTYAVAHAAIRQRFEAQWGATTDVQWPSTKYTPGEDPWVRLQIAPANALWASFGDPGNNVERNLGQVTVQIFVQSGEGEGLAMEYADQVRAVFRNWRDAVSGVRFLEPPYARQIGFDGKWFQVNVVAPFQFDDYT
ncbi:tail terminator [Dinoroseobacter phage vB_DshS-R5C]|uniref:Structural protein n=1 Tax=Dinoroseobacter phage vB_DshS-R5C TaxID=1965368 RepID=A0A1V0DY86_9CAUD|nr:tail terminator [Dinoroseobacter phage vB_DshS-R5C]ARB06113.1 structural protein [Dinoroseobacter phage vB_DshS-R5C]